MIKISWTIQGELKTNSLHRQQKSLFRAAYFLKKLSSALMAISAACSWLLSLNEALYWHENFQSHIEKTSTWCFTKACKYINSKTICLNNTIHETSGSTFSFKCFFNSCLEKKGYEAQGQKNSFFTLDSKERSRNALNLWFCKRRCIIAKLAYILA